MGSVCPNLVQNFCSKCGSFTSREPSPKIVVRMGVEKKVMMVSRIATPAVIKDDDNDDIYF